MSDTKAGSEQFAQWFAKSGFNTRACAEDSWNASRRKTAQEITQKLRAEAKTLLRIHFDEAAHRLEMLTDRIEAEFGLAGKESQ